MAILPSDTTDLYNCFVEKRKGGVIRIANNTGAALVQRELTMIQGFFGMAKEDAAIDEVFALEWSYNIEVQSDQLKAADTFALSADESPAYVYWDSANKELSDTATIGYYRVGLLTKALGTDDFIKFYMDPVPVVVV
jgi:hypothetical protein